jgi:hypothetical protein
MALPPTLEPGISTIAFALKEPIDSYGGKTAELAMDLTCESQLPFAMIITYVTLEKTNAAAYELAHILYIIQRTSAGMS